MKKMKKVMALLLSLVMVLAMSVVAFADEATYTITIKNAETGHTYEAYQIFAGTLSDGVLSDISWGNGVRVFEYDNTSVAKDIAKALTAANAEDFAAVAGGNLTAITSGTYLNGKIIGLTAGYYLVKDKDGSVSGQSSYTSYLLRVAGNVEVTPKTGVPTVEKKVKENVKTVSYFQSLLKNKYMSKVPIDHLFESGRAAFKIDGAWEVNALYTSYPDVSFGVAPYVVGDSWNGERYAPTGSWAFAASSKTKHIKGATELVKWMSGVDSGKRLWEKSKSFPSTYEAYETIDVFQKDENYKALYYQLSNYGHPRPKTPAYPQVSTSFQQVLENCVLSGFDPQEQLDKSVERINAKLKRYTLE